MTRIALALVTLIVAPAAQAGLFQDWWAPADTECTSDEAVQQAARADLMECRLTHSSLTATGELRPAWPLVEACMERRGWVEVSRVEFLSWQDACSPTVVASTSPEPAVEERPVRTRSRRSARRGADRRSANHPQRGVGVSPDSEPAEVGLPEVPTDRLPE